MKAERTVYWSKYDHSSGFPEAVRVKIGGDPSRLS